jgi:hypothetical protein
MKKDKKGFISRLWRWVLLMKHLIRHLLPHQKRGGIPFRGTGCIHFVVRSAGGILVVFNLFPCWQFLLNSGIDQFFFAYLFPNSRKLAENGGCAFNILLSEMRFQILRWWWKRALSFSTRPKLASCDLSCRCLDKLERLYFEMCFFF